MASNVEGLEKTLAAIGSSLRDTDEALVALARGLAAAVDAEPSNAALWREYRAAVASLQAAAAGVVDDDDTAVFLAAIRTPLRAALGDRSES
jgi:hypothetical protein